MIRIYLLAADAAICRDDWRVAYAMLKLALGHANRIKSRKRASIMTAMNYVRVQL